MGVRKVGRRAVFFDRDGVLNEAIVRDGKPYPPADLSQFRVVPHARVELAALKRAGFLLFVFTNQPDVARGSTKRDQVEVLNDALREALPVDEILVCYHDDAAMCACRKPAPGMIFKAAERYNIDLAGSYVVGDRWRDIDAGRVAGCTTIWLDMGYAEGLGESVPDLTVRSLADATREILRRAAGLE